MSAVPNELFGRRCSLLVSNGVDALELSDLRVTFETRQEDEESPNNCKIRVYNLGRDQMQLIQDEYTEVILQAGYWGAPFGVIFKGQIKQFRKGREDSKTTYLDILAADGDEAYNFAMVNRTLVAGSDPKQRVAAIAQAMGAKGVEPGSIEIPGTGGILPRGKVLFGLARVAMRQETRARGATWNINNGQVNVVPLDSYLPGEAVVLTVQTGLIGRPEQTEGGLRATCLINPRITVGGLVKIDNGSINQTIQQRGFAVPGAQIPYDRYAGIQQFADITADGLYRAYVVECVGDTRGQDWYMHLVLLAVDPVTLKLKPY